jgi:hypothetical protein
VRLTATLGFLVKVRRKWVIAGLVAGIPLAIWVASYHPAEFRGAGALRDTGFFSYYRYHAPIGAAPLATAGTHSFRFSGLPSENFGLMFYLPGKTEKDRELFSSLTTKLSAQLLDSNGNVLCAATGIPGTKAEHDRWVLMSSFRDSGYWHESCRTVPLSRWSDYELRVTVDAIDPRSPAVEMLAMLEGGGNELP